MGNVPSIPRFCLRLESLPTLALTVLKREIIGETATVDNRSEQADRQPRDPKSSQTQCEVRRHNVPPPEFPSTHSSSGKPGSPVCPQISPISNSGPLPVLQNCFPLIQAQRRDFDVPAFKKREG